MQVGDFIELSIHGMSHDGRAVGRHESGITVFVEGALTGQKVQVELLSLKKRLAEAVLISVLEHSEYEETRSICEHVSECGGCAWMGLKYERQLEEKELSVRNALTRIGKLTDFADQDCSQFLPIIGMGQEDYQGGAAPVAYRNKMEFAFSLDSDDCSMVGLKRKYSHDIVEVTNCKMQDARTMEVIRAVRQFIENRCLYFLRYLVVRSLRTKQLSVEIITFDFDRNPAVRKEMKEVIAELARTIMSVDGVQGCMHSIRKAKTDVAYGEQMVKTWGKTEMFEEIQLAQTGQKHRFSLGNRAFFQVNTRMAEKLYGLVYEFAQMALFGKVKQLLINPKHTKTAQNAHIWDMYAGVGSISRSVAKLAQGQYEYATSLLTDEQRNSILSQLKDDKHEVAKKSKAFVFGLESVTSAVELAKENTKDIPFAQFAADKVENLHKYLKQYALPDLIILDPPRAGLEPKVIETLSLAKIPYCIMVSCNPTTLARDLEALSKEYKVCAVQAVDLFPHTPHVETVVLLSCKTSI